VQQQHYQQQHQPPQYPDAPPPHVLAIGSTLGQQDARVGASNAG
jgi:hypothetical protein